MAAPTCRINDALRVFNAHTDRKGFGFHVNAALVQQGEGVAGAVPQSEHHMLRGQMCSHTCMAIFDVQASDVSA